MKPKNISQVKNPDLRASQAALERAAQLARKVAIQTNTGIVVVQDGEIIHISADELRAEQLEKEKE